MSNGVTELAAIGAYPAGEERRQPAERRRQFVWSLVYGGVYPRRRRGRRAGDRHRPIVDWHSPALLFSSVALLILSLCDAALTLVLLQHGASEANPVMALVVDGDVARFALIKLALTGGGLVTLVAIARFTVFRFFRAELLVHLAMAGYVVLIVYEAWLVGFLVP